MFNDNFSLHYLVGSGDYVRHRSPISSVEPFIIEMCTYLSRPDLPRTVDAMELFGGVSGVWQVCGRRRLNRGVDSDTSVLSSPWSY